MNFVVSHRLATVETIGRQDLDIRGHNYSLDSEENSYGTSDGLMGHWHSPAFGGENSRVVRDENFLNCGWPMGKVTVMSRLPVKKIMIKAFW